MGDILIIGTGGAALTTALVLQKRGVKVLVVGKQHPTNSQTSMAQGGINAALANVEGDADSVQIHIDDTIKSAKNLCDEAMVRTMCQDAPQTIKWLESIGVPFSRMSNAKVAQRKLGGASHKRACYSQDYTGLKILHTLYDNCLKEGVEFLNEHYLLDLMTDNKKNNTVNGAIVLDIATGETKQIIAKAVIIATGGYSSIYHGFTTNAFGSTGDGMVAVLRAGGSLCDMEFVQFHPTALKSSAILISESARGEGGYLLNGKGERFVDELLPRDVVARAIYEQIGNGQEVFLDIRHLGEEKLMELLPQEVHLCRLHEGIDPLRELIPIKPVAHYSMGGIDVDRSLAVRGIRGCFAVGECSNAKVHGANRLGGNSLLEIITFGKLVAQSAIEYISDIEVSSVDAQVSKNKKEIDILLKKENRIDFYSLRETIGELFYRNVGIIRERAGLYEALAKIEQIKESLPDIGVGDRSKSYNMNLVEFLEFANTVALSETILQSAIAREESRGAHYRADFPNADDEKYALHSLCSLKDGQIQTYFERNYQ